VGIQKDKGNEKGQRQE